MNLMSHCNDEEFSMFILSDTAFNLKLFNIILY